MRSRAHAGTSATRAVRWPRQAAQERRRSGARAAPQRNDAQRACEVVSHVGMDTDPGRSQDHVHGKRRDRGRPWGPGHAGESGQTMRSTDCEAGAGRGGAGRPKAGADHRIGTGHLPRRSSDLARNVAGAGHEASAGHRGGARHGAEASGASAGRQADRLRCRRSLVAWGMMRHAMRMAQVMELGPANGPAKESGYGVNADDLIGQVMGSGTAMWSGEAMASGRP